MAPSRRPSRCARFSAPRMGGDNKRFLQLLAMLVQARTVRFLVERGPEETSVPRPVRQDASGPAGGRDGALRRDDQLSRARRAQQPARASPSRRRPRARRLLCGLHGDRVVGADHPRVLRRHRRHGAHGVRQRGMADPQGHCRPVGARGAAHSRRDDARSPNRRDRQALVQDRFALRIFSTIRSAPPRRTRPTGR